MILISLRNFTCSCMFISFFNFHSVFSVWVYVFFISYFSTWNRDSSYDEHQLRLPAAQKLTESALSQCISILKKKEQNETTVKPLYSGHPSDFSKVSTIERLSFFQKRRFSTKHTRFPYKWKVLASKIPDWNKLLVYFQWFLFCFLKIERLTIIKRMFCRVFLSLSNPDKFQLIVIWDRTWKRRAEAVEWTPKYAVSLLVSILQAKLTYSPPQTYLFPSSPSISTGFFRCSLA